MSVEIEVKMRIEDRERFRDRLLEMAGEPVACVISSDTFFDIDEQDLQRSDCGLRLRVERDPDDGSVLRGVMCYKGPREAGSTKRREEIEFAVDDPGNAALLLERLGYREQIMYQKRRQSWSVDGCRVDLDHVPYLGDFAEIEGRSEDAILAVRQKLGLEEEPIVRDSYPAMLDAYLSDHGISSRRVMLNDA